MTGYRPTPVRGQKRASRAPWFQYILAVLVITICGNPSAAAQHDAGPDLVGNYRTDDGRWLGISPFTTDNGEAVSLFADYGQNIVRRLYSGPDDELVMGPAFATRDPVELRVRTETGGGKIIGLTLIDKSGRRRASRVDGQAEEVHFQGQAPQLAGTLYLPAGAGPHPAIILLHGSGPLTRTSFGPYPQFFTSLGFAVLTYDKRGTGKSTGVRTDASTATAMTTEPYPDPLIADALAGLQLLRARPDVDAKRIGFWGSSEGGMLALQAAARSRDVAFAINSSGFVGTLGETLRYQARAIRTEQGEAKDKIDEESAFVDLWLKTAQGGKGWAEFQRARNAIVEKNGSWIFQSRGEPKFMAELRWDWDHLLSFDSRVGLERIRCPVLALFGAKDVLTDPKTGEELRRLFEEAGHKDVTIKVIPNASHSLMETPSRRGMAPGVFETLQSWLAAPVGSRTADLPHKQGAL